MSRANMTTPPEDGQTNLVPGADPRARPTFPKDGIGFQAELRRRVRAYFERSARADRDSPRMYLKTAVILAWLAASYALLVFGAPAWWLAVPLAVSLALAMAAVGFNIQHDGGHQAYSRRPWVNRLAALSLDLIGGSSYLWRTKHGVLHHTYTNVDGLDTDIEAGPLARFSPHQKWRWFHRWQHIYLWPLYALTAPRWHLWGDFKDVAVGRIGPHKVPRPRGWDLAGFVGGKLLSLVTLFAVPMLFHPWWVVILFYLLVTGVLGMVLTVVFQLAHCVEEAEFPVPDGGGGQPRLGRAWAVHQVETTVDFARNSRVLSWLLGGLNFQVEHHLFPRVCHVHYRALSAIVEQTCRDFGVMYRAHRSFLAGVASHYRWLRRMGAAPSRPPAAREAGREWRIADLAADPTGPSA